MSTCGNSLRWSDFVKSASPEVIFGKNTFRIPKGKTLTNVVREYGTLHPEQPISVSDIISANGGLEAEKFQADKDYFLPQNGSQAQTQAAPDPSKPPAYYRWPPHLQRMYDNEKRIVSDRRKRLDAAVREYGAGKVPIEVLRRAYNGK